MFLLLGKHPTINSHTNHILRVVKHEMQSEANELLMEDKR